MNIGELKKHLDGYSDETPCAYDLWLPEDVEQRAQEEGRDPLTPDQVAEVLEKVQGSKDANYGICWDTISCALDEVVPEGAVAT